MRILVMLLLDTLPMLGNVLLLCFFVFFIFGIIGIFHLTDMFSLIFLGDIFRSPAVGGAAETEMLHQ